MVKEQTPQIVTHVSTRPSTPINTDQFVVNSVQAAKQHGIDIKTMIENWVGMRQGERWIDATVEKAITNSANTLVEIGAAVHKNGRYYWHRYTR